MGAEEEGDLQSPVRASNGETAPKQAKDEVGRQCASGRPIPGSQGSARDRGQWKAVIEAAVGL